jgi:hypothetical protein
VSIPSSYHGSLLDLLTLFELIQLVLQRVEKYGGQYIGFFSEPPPASQETVSASIERLLVASTPWQDLMMHIRRIYRWENHTETVAYLVAYVILWAIGGLCAAAVSHRQLIASHGIWAD